jgi:hypothetical protein
VIRGSLFFSGLINIGHGWQYQFVEDQALTQTSNYDIAYDNLNGFSFSDYPKANQEQSYFLYSIVYFLINFGAFFILNTTLEVKLVRRMHDELVQKRERLAKMNANR